MLKVDVIGYTVFNGQTLDDAFDWDTDAIDASALSEAAGRVSYMSWKKPNPATATNESYLANIINQGHFSVMRHGSVSVFVQGMSRDCSMQLIRHHVGTAVSQLSQRYVDAEDMGYVVPPAMRGKVILENLLKASWAMEIERYQIAVDHLTLDGMTRKQAREAARAFLPGCTETKMVYTGNHEAWRKIISARATMHADAEIRQFAVQMFRILSQMEPNLYQDMHIVTSDGVQVVALR